LRETEGGVQASRRDRRTLVRACPRSRRHAPDLAEWPRQRSQTLSPPPHGHNLGLLTRLLIGAGTPKETSARGKALLLLVSFLDSSILVLIAAIGSDHAVLA
jgi:hypothetical protein